MQSKISINLNWCSPKSPLNDFTITVAHDIGNRALLNGGQIIIRSSLKCSSCIAQSKGKAFFVGKYTGQ